MTHIIATMKAWQIFLILCTTAALMVYLISYYGLGMLIAMIVIHTWLYSMTIELAKHLEKNTSRYKRIYYFCIAASIATTGPLYFLPFGSILVPIFMLILFGCIVFLMFEVGELLGHAEHEQPSKINGAILVYAWPIGVWFLQPRLRSVLVGESSG